LSHSFGARDRPQLKLTTETITKGNERIIESGDFQRTDARFRTPHALQIELH
jgi:hypothetical protein